MKVLGTSVPIFTRDIEAAIERLYGVPEDTPRAELTDDDTHFKSASAHARETGSC